MRLEALRIDEFFVDDAKRCTRAQVAGKVHFPAEYFRDVRDHAVRDSARHGGHVETVVDGPGNEADSSLVVDRIAARNDGVVSALGYETGLLIDVEGETVEILAALVDIERDGLAGVHAIEIVDFLRCLHPALDLGGVDSGGVEDVGYGLAAANAVAKLPKTTGGAADMLGGGWLSSIGGFRHRSAVTLHLGLCIEKCAEALTCACMVVAGVFNQRDSRASGPPALRAA